MKHLLLALCLAAPVADFAQDRVTVRGTWRTDADQSWTYANSERWISLQLQYDQHNSGFGVPERDLPALADRRADGPVRFALSRDAGRFEFTGDVRNGRGGGEFTFAPSAEFVSGMGRLGYPRLSDEEVWRFAMHDITRTYVSDFKTAGYQLDTSDLIKSRIHGATPAFAQQMAQETKTRLEIDQLITFRIHGVTPDFIKTFSDLGYKNLAGDDLVKMRIHGVTPEFVRALSDLGYKNVPLDDLVRMRIHGVTPEYIKQMRDAGYPNIKVDRLVQFRIHGVDEDLIRRARAHGFNDLSADDLVDLAIHGRRWLKG